MKTHNKVLAILLSLVMVFTVFSVALVPATAAENEVTDLLGQYFSTENEWYDTVTDNGSALQWQDGDYPVYNKVGDGMTYLNNYLKIANTNLFSGVNQSTGVTFAFNYRANTAEQHRHIISLGNKAYSTTENVTANHFYISGTTSWKSDGHFPMVGWVNGNGGETIDAYPADVTLVGGKEYNIVVSVDYNEGVVFYIDGVKRTTVYNGSNLADQLSNIRAFLAEVNTYGQNYIGISRWRDGALDGYLSDLRIYGSSMTDETAANLINDMAAIRYPVKPTYYTVRLHLTDITKCDDTNKDGNESGKEGTYIQIKYRENNGTGEEKTMQIYGTSDNNYGQGWNEKFYTYLDTTTSARDTNPVVIPGFPTNVLVSVRVGGSVLQRRTCKVTATLQVLNSDGTWTDLATTDQVNLNSTYSATQQKNKDVDSSLYPYVASATEIAGADEITLPCSGEAQTSTYSLTAVDQYGVNWVNSEWTADNGAANSATRLINNVTFSTPGTVNLTAKLDGNVTKTKTVTVNATPHTGGAATCVAQAVCDVCAQPYGDVDLVNGHNYPENWSDNGDKDVHSKACLNGCGMDYDLTEDHDWDNGVWVDGKAPTCTDGATKLYTCSECGATKTEDEDALGHDYTGMEWKYLDEELHAMDCAVCGEAGRKTESHNWTAWSGDENTHSRSCPDCKKEETGDHNWVEDEEQYEAPTEEKEGKRVYHCDDCNATKTESIPQLNHEHDYEGQPWVSDGRGKHYQVCKNGCGVNLEEDCDGKVDGARLEPTCGKDGYAEHICSVCGYKATETLSATGEHNFTVEVDRKDATCVGNGYVKYECANGCGETQTSTILPTGKHTGGTATCQAPATCEVCGNEYGSKDPNNHAGLSEWTVIEDATCLAAGKKAAICGACDHEVTEVIPAVPHKDDNEDGICDYFAGTADEHSMPGSQLTSNEFRCGFCNTYESKQGTALNALFRVIHAIIHYFSYLIYTFGFRFGR